MEFIRTTYANTGTLHHAYCIESSGSDTVEQLCAFFEQDLKHPTQANPDFWIGQFDSVGIDEGRMLKEMQLMRPAAHPRKVFVLQTNGITREAQNSLLKIFEEPTPDTHFFLIIPSAALLLPTLRSRLLILSAERNTNGADVSFAKKFLSSSKAERLDMLKDMIEEKDRTKVAAFLDAVEVVLREKLNLMKPDPALMARVEALLAVKKYIHDRSSSVKMILEHVALAC